MKQEFAKDIDWFVKNIKSRKRLLPAFAHAAQSMTKEVSTNLDSFIDEHGSDKVYDEDGELTQFIVPEEYYRRYGILKRSFQHSAIFSELLPKMTLVSLVSLFDAFISRLVRTMFRVNPSILKGSEKQLTFAEISEFENIDEAKEYLIGLEIESLLRCGHDEQFAWLENKLQLPLRKDLPAWETFNELTQRRNLLVHADGLVTKNYLKDCAKKGIRYGEDVRIGGRLDVPPKYYDNACNCVAEIGIKLAQVMWRKMLPEEVDAADSSLIQVSFDFLNYADYELALVVTQFNDIPAIKNATLENTYYLKINQAIALKNLKKEKESLDLLATIDWSASSDIFKLAVAALREDWSEAADLMESLGPNHKKIGKGEYKQWPVFKWFRKSEEFKKSYEKVFGEEFKIVGSPASADAKKSADA